VHIAAVVEATRQLNNTLVAVRHTDKTVLLAVVERLAILLQKTDLNEERIAEWDGDPAMQAGALDGVLEIISKWGE